MESTQIEQRNQQYRDQEPSALHQAAFHDVLEGKGISEKVAEEMVDRLYDPFPGGKKETPVDPFEETITGEEGNGLASAVVRHDHSITLHISEKLWEQQPIGVLLRPINDEVRKAGEALITDVGPRSADVESGVMPAYHYKLRIVPTPIWLSRWVGENGYPTI